MTTQEQPIPLLKLDIDGLRRDINSQKISTLIPFVTLQTGETYLAFDPVRDQSQFLGITIRVRFLFTTGMHEVPVFTYVLQLLMLIVIS